MTDGPDDATLTREGADLAAPGGGVLLVACGALAREILALKRANGWDQLELVCLPAILHNRPERIAPEVRRIVEARRAGFDEVFVVYADCGTGGALQSLCDELGIGMVAGPHCYAFFEGVEAFAARAADEIDTFYLTDFLARQFDAFVIRPLGLDRHPELRDAYFGHYRRLVYLAQTEDGDLDRRAREAAERLGLDYERRFTGYGDLPAILGGLGQGSSSERRGGSVFRHARHR